MRDFQDWGERGGESVGPEFGCEVGTLPTLQRTD